MWFFLYLFLALLLLLPRISHAQREPTQLRFDHITVNDGLSHSDALCIAQDRRGFIWIGTHKGVNRYDGYRLKTYDLPINNRNGMISNRVRALHVDAQGTLWVGIDGAGLFWYNPNRDRFESILERPVAASCQSLIQKLLTRIFPYSHPMLSENSGSAPIKHGLFMLQFDQQNT
ncbi:hypothetical protein BWI97_26695, partial [Siphonobacter sp. BAB-5405]